jgi:SRSO17 transposase
LLSAVEHKNSWQLSQEEGFETPYRFQHLLGRALWNADAVRDFHQAWVAQTLRIAQGVLILDDTGFLKKGKHSAGVARQYSGTAGRINCLGPSYLRWVLIRRSMGSQDLSFYLVFAPASPSLEKMVEAAGHRWKIEESFESAKGEVGLDQYEVRSFRGWYRHMTLALLSLGLLKVT